MTDPTSFRNVQAWATAARDALDAEILEYLNGGADDQRTLRRNESAFAEIALRARRLVDVSQVETSVEIFGERWPYPFALAPVGFQEMFHGDAEAAVARAAQSRSTQMLAARPTTSPIMPRVFMTRVVPRASWVTLMQRPAIKRLSMFCE